MSSYFSHSGAKVPRSESTRERKFQRTKVPESKSSRERKFHLWYFRSSTWKRKFQLPTKHRAGWDGHTGRTGTVALWHSQINQQRIQTVVTAIHLMIL